MLFGEGRAAVRYRFGVHTDDGVWHEEAGCAFLRFCGGMIAEWREYSG